MVSEYAEALPGESAWKVAERLGVDPLVLIAWNPWVRDTTIYPGDRLLIPVDAPVDPEPPIDPEPEPPIDPPVDPVEPPAGWFAPITVDGIIRDHFDTPKRSDGRFPNMGKHKMELVGVNPGWDWGHGARLGEGEHRPLPKSANRDHHNIWGQAMIGDGHTPVRDVRLQVGRWQVWHLRSNGWVPLRDDSSVGEIQGAFQGGMLYRPNTIIRDGYVRPEDVGYSIDLRPCVKPDGTPTELDTFAHWYYRGFWPRQPIQQGTQMVALLCQMRLISDDPNVNVDDAKFVGCIGGDVFAEAKDAGTNTNAAFSMPIHRRLTSEWQSFSCVTGREADQRELLPGAPFLDDGSN